MHKWMEEKESSAWHECTLTNYAINWWGTRGDMASIERKKKFSSILLLPFQNLYYLVWNSNMHSHRWTFFSDGKMHFHLVYSHKFTGHHFHSSSIWISMLMIIFALQYNNSMSFKRKKKKTKKLNKHLFQKVIHFKTLNSNVN